MIIITISIIRYFTPRVEAWMPVAIKHISNCHVPFRLIKVENPTCISITCRMDMRVPPACSQEYSGY